MDLKGSFVEVTTELKNLKSSVDSVKSKVDDLVNWKNKTLGGAIVLGVVATLLGVLVTKASDYISLKTPQAAAAPQPAPTPLGNQPAKSGCKGGYELTLAGKNHRKPRLIWTNFLFRS